MNLYITQNSYYFVHRHFINLFGKEKSKIIYVKESGRGITKKYIEIIQNFGLLNTLICSFLEILYFTLLIKRVLKLETSNINDINLNAYLDDEIKSKKYKNVISIGCPCMIDSDLQQKYQISIINLHGGIIPYQKGRFSPLKSIKNGHQYLGASLYYISNSFDEGSLISQDYFLIKNTRIISNYNKVLNLSANLLEKFFQNEIKTIPTNVLESFHRDIKHK
jgi:folate-dependent phosphoribosylglycinamide formyltransferase PurN